MEKFLITKHKEAARKVEKDGSQSPTSVTPEDVAPSTSVYGGKLNQDEAAT